MGQRIGYVRGEHGNVGDTLQEKAFYGMAREYGLDVRWVSPTVRGREPWDWEKADGLWNGKIPLRDIDELVLFGGGNMGLKGGSWRIRQKALMHGLPITILPNSWRAPELLPTSVRLCARERESISLYAPRAELWPDIGLGYWFRQEHVSHEPSRRLGIFLRDDREGRFSDTPGNQGAPFKLIGKRDVRGYLRLASDHRVVVTDALHFSICALAAGRRVYLLPGSYHKNRSMWETWLRNLGCLWAEDPGEVALERGARS